MQRYRIIFIIFLILWVSGGCYSIRKKFVRKKTYKKPPLVYVDFKEYPLPSQEELYRSYYVFVQGWFDDLVRSLESVQNRKKQKQAIREILANLEQMRNFFNEEGRKETLVVYGSLLEIKEQIFSPVLNEVVRRELAGKVRYLRREFERKFKLKNASKWFK